MQSISLRGLLRAAFNVFGVIVLLLLAGAIYTLAVEAGQRAQFPPPGRLVDIGDGRVVHLRLWGENQPGPTFVLDVSAQTPSSAYAWLGTYLGEHHRVVAYDRPGMAWSSGGVGPRDAKSAADALSAALEAAGIGPPYVVVAHSYGGLSARVFAQLRRADVMALVLLDTTHPDGRGSGYGTLARIRALLGHFGVWQLLPRLGNELDSLPIDEARAANAAALWTSTLDASADELEAWNASTAQARAASDFDDLPVLIVSSGGNDEQSMLQRDLTRLSRASELVELHGVGHLTMLTVPETARHIADLIADFLARRAPQPVF